MKGWFDAFRYDGGPTLYSFNNRTAVTGDVTLITFLTIFCTLYVAFLIIFPGIRKERFTTFFMVTLSLFVGATILVSMFGSAWQIGSAPIVSTYRAFSNERIAADLGVFIGLAHVNITLRGAALANWTSDVDFNERFLWVNADQMGDSFREAIERGLPYPILTVAEYFTTGQEGLSWGGQYRAAGYFATIMLWEGLSWGGHYRAAGYFAIIMLWASFAIWFLMNLMLVVVPRYGAVLMTTCGFLLLATVCGYFGMLPETSLVINVEGTNLHFCFGWCYWLVLIAGGLCLLAGVIITTIEIIYPHSFSTILEVDYDTPYDRHIIIEDSHGRRSQKKKSNNGKLEEQSGGGLKTKIFRRLSSKTHEVRTSPVILKPVDDPKQMGSEIKSSNWHYPFRPTSSLDRKTSTLSRGSEGSSLSRHIPSAHKDYSRYKPPPERLQEVSMW